MMDVLIWAMLATTIVIGLFEIAAWILILEIIKHQIVIEKILKEMDHEGKD